MTTHLPLRDAVVRNDPAAVTLALDEGALDGYLRDGVRWSWLAEALPLGHREAARACRAHPRGFLFEAQCAALEFVRRVDPNSDLGHRVTPWIPVIERILAGKDVGLNEILRLGRRREKP